MAATVYELFRATANAHPDNSFICVPSRADRQWSPDGLELSYGAVADEVERLRALYAAAGYGHGHRVALLLEMRPEFFHHSLALNALGVGIVPINPDYRHDEMAYQMSHSEAELAVVVSHRVADLVRVGADRQRETGQALPVVDAFAMPAAVRCGVSCRDEDGTARRSRRGIALWTRL